MLRWTRSALEIWRDLMVYLGLIICRTQCCETPTVSPQKKCRTFSSWFEQGHYCCKCQSKRRRRSSKEPCDTLQILTVELFKKLKNMNARELQAAFCSAEKKVTWKIFSNWHFESTRNSSLSPASLLKTQVAFGDTSSVILHTSARKTAGNNELKVCRRFAQWLSPLGHRLLPETPVGRTITNEPLLGKKRLAATEFGQQIFWLVQS